MKAKIFTTFYNCLLASPASKSRLIIRQSIALNEHFNSIAKIDFPFYSIDWRFKAK